ncbi:MAG: class I SAM-dependent methyltransferase [Planctomycetota bacterium]
MRKKSIIQHLWDFVGMPFRLVLLSQRWLPKLGWTTLEEERLAAVLPQVKGRLLDVGAGPNRLVNLHGDGVGVDVYDWGGGVVVVADTSHLPFEDASFDTVTFVACLNHIPYRLAALQEARRVIRPDGRLVITMINPIFGGVIHKIRWDSEDKERGGMKEGETGGLWTSRLVALCREAGFDLDRHLRFVYGMNNLYIFRPRGTA